MGSEVTLDRAVLAQLMVIVQALGAGADLDDILEQIARAVVDVIGFDAVAVNVVMSTGDLEVRTVVGPPELDELRGGTLTHSDWLELLDSCEHWGELRFLRTPDLDVSIPHVDPWPERIHMQPDTASPEIEPWQPEFALLAPMWRAQRDLLGVISVDLPRSGYTPGRQQRALLELFAGQAAAAVSRVQAFDRATDRAGLYRAAFAASPAPTLVLDVDLTVTDVNDAFLDMADAIVDEVLGRKITDLVMLSDATGLASTMGALGSTEAMEMTGECELLHPRGIIWERWVHVQMRRVDGAVSGLSYVCILTDRTALRRSMQALQQRADYDDLTSLHVRAAGIRELKLRTSAPAVADERTGQAVRAVMYCDLDNFKHINDTDGHRAGDEVLAAVARHLLNAAAESDVVCRWGGDEFVAIVERPTMAEIIGLGHRFVGAVQALAGTAPAGTALAQLDMSVGIAEFMPPTDFSAILEAADAALYRAKSDPECRVHVVMQ
ncbi:diguanylate cyclase [Mycobacterium sp. 236(2023)]|uniref:sensor domain-containing diguanylate cyclase n=1 Tax=Mycobacterium sp. 236(2023) TaxID=3038163 RepID=UPI0024158859|nr:diguanylate cyclase [Mycobacterium sp. 236(2023)]MDG4669346.1 diguanylate cyclase [Mycobacterium sp. 236(2023)]